jgi:hypothetical protein
VALWSCAGFLYSSYFHIDRPFPTGFDPKFFVYLLMVLGLGTSTSPAPSAEQRLAEDP